MKFFVVTAVKEPLNNRTYVKSLRFHYFLRNLKHYIKNKKFYLFMKQKLNRCLINNKGLNLSRRQRKILVQSLVMGKNIY
jgi:hypothetical protein